MCRVTAALLGMLRMGKRHTNGHFHEFGAHHDKSSSQSDNLSTKQHLQRISKSLLGTSAKAMEATGDEQHAAVQAPPKRRYRRADLEEEERKKSELVVLDPEGDDDECGILCCLKNRADGVCELSMLVARIFMSQAAAFLAYSKVLCTDSADGVIAGQRPSLYSVCAARQGCWQNMHLAVDAMCPLTSDVDAGREYIPVAKRRQLEEQKLRKLLKVCLAHTAQPSHFNAAAMYCRPRSCPTLSC
jgi:hypothetical protein